MKRRFIQWLLRQTSVQLWLRATERPQASRAEVKWTKDDANAMEGFMRTGTGQKLMLELENMKADTDAAAVLRSTDRTAFALTSYARGVRQVIGRIKQLSVVRQSPDETEDEADSLPPELAHLSET